MHMETGAKGDDLGVNRFACTLDRYAVVCTVLRLVILYLTRRDESVETSWHLNILVWRYPQHFKT